MDETTAYQMIVESSEAKCDIKNYRNGGKWITVGYFTEEPRENPRKSKAMIECAKFASMGDAWMHANLLARRPNAEWWWAVVVR